MVTDKTIGTRGREFIGTVIRARMQKTATVEWPRTVFLPKYERSMTKRTRVKAHNPEGIDAKVGDKVRVKECRPLSKTKSFIITEKLGVDYDFLARAENLKAALAGRAEEAKARKAKAEGKGEAKAEAKGAGQ
jgi:small subunit ribosomal protein S17